MPVKHDTQRRWVEMEFIVPGTPEQVWQAIATGPGNTAWFTPATIEERVGGAIKFDFGGGMSSSGTVTAFEPPHRFCYEERDWNGDAPPVATEVVITSYSGDRCIVRMVHSMFSTEDTWDDQFEGFEAGWPGFFEILRVYLKHFPDAKAASVRVMGKHDGPIGEAWAKLTTALGLEGANVGERRIAPANVPALIGVVERVHQVAGSCDVMLRLEEPHVGVAYLGTFALENKARAGISIYFYGDDAAEMAAQNAPLWATWMSENFPS
jgi:uncharacterized protein YndB with AHSA1/START domain